KSKGVLITGLKLKAFRNPQPSWGFSIDKKPGNARFFNEKFYLSKPTTIRQRSLQGFWLIAM
ncbi:hypothetical protein, partial [Salmonella enterica]|uniref:hypothetical protein n=1 Tax=Salmonella enterica TaxID=28901 RepID=UPI001C378BDD